MENPNLKPFCSFLSRSVFKRDGESVLQEQLLLVRSGFSFPLRIETWLASGLLLRPLPWRLLSPLFMWMLLEANLGLGSFWSSLPRPLDKFLKPT